MPLIDRDSLMRRHLRLEKASDPRHKEQVAKFFAMTNKPIPEHIIRQNPVPSHEFNKIGLDECTVTVTFVGADHKAIPLRLIDTASDMSFLSAKDTTTLMKADALRPHGQVEVQTIQGLTSFPRLTTRVVTHGGMIKPMDVCTGSVLTQTRIGPQSRVHNSRTASTSSSKRRQP